MKIFLDANIIFSACNHGSNVYKFVKFLSKKHELVTCDYAVEEAMRNLHVKKPEWAVNYRKISKSLVILPAHNKDFGVELAAKDIPIIASAIMHKCDYLVTGDKKDFKHLYGKTVMHVKILPPDKLMEEIKDLE